MKRTSNRWLGALQGYKRRLGYCWHRFKMQHTHWIVTSESAGGGFVAYGSWRAVTHFSRNFLGAPDDLRIKRRWHGQVPAETIRQQARRFGLVTMASTQLPKALRGTAVMWPSLVRLEAKIAKTAEARWQMLGGLAKADLRRIKREQYTMAVLPAVPAFEEFYGRFYLPSMRKRHGEDAYLHGFNAEFNKLGPSDVILEVRAPNACVGKVVICEEGDGVRMSRLGWLDGRDDIYQKSVLGALYWFSM
ncbi:MAG: hypothetical protein H7A44_06220 [Opitutaceae bacterium]|nr:hypothetical protein [Cephaloticoccus sp.]MCP5530018.1 hypothetical protein [Opitutaceae bacterium]